MGSSLAEEWPLATRGESFSELWIETWKYGVPKACGVVIWFWSMACCI